ncbi:MAG: RsmB/NOP family class I SAM-dependent RNA methyltransferase [Deltaproteobacteria bacterium]
MKEKSVRQETGLSTKLRPDLVQAAALEVLGQIREEGRLADRALSVVLRRDRRLWSAERRAAAEQVYGFLRNERLVERVLELALERAGLSIAGFSSTEADVARLAVWANLAGTSPPPGLERSLRTAVSRAVELRAELLAAREGVDRLSLAASLPEWLVRRLSSHLGESETERLCAALNERAPLTLRTNLLRAGRDEVIELLTREGVGATPTRYSPWGARLDDRTNAFSLDAFRKGLFEVQDEGSQLLALLCGEPPGKLVVDACAGAGGKTLALAALMGNRGELWALDARADRLELLRPRARRAGAHNVRLQAITDDGPFPRSLHRIAGRADCVLVDAPCSGIGALRRNPDARRRLTEASVEEHAARQLSILIRSAKLVRAGGRLVYATCSLLWEENESIVERFLARGGFALESWEQALGPSLGRSLAEPIARGPAALSSPLGLRLWPQRHGTDGFFGAILRRVESPPVSERR